MDPLVGALAFGLALGLEDDKQKHFVAGGATALVAREIWDNPLAPCLAALGVGLAKEAYDSKFGGHVEAEDVLATVAGCGVTWKF